MTATLDDLATRIDRLHAVVLGRFDGVDQRLDKLDRRMDALEQRTDGLGQRMDALDRRMAALEQRMDRLEQRTDGLERRVDALASRTAAFEQRLDKVEQRLQTLETEVRALRLDHERLLARVDEMTAGGKLTLAFLARQQERILEDHGRMRDDLTVLSGMAMRLDGVIQGLTLEIRGAHSRYDRLARELARLGERLPSPAGG
ncbi:MAG: hypothetical protein NZP72_03355 [Geminicoccaceae bacterium]|nr:hypothetical protein [Geminicoccaceae bacterium]